MIVFDASTLILLAKVDVLEALTQEQAIVITPLVEEESTRPDAPDAKLITRLINEKKITIKEVSAGFNEIRKLAKDFSMDEGEASSLWLAGRLNAPIATDDGLAIRAAKVLGIGFAMAIHFLIQLYKKGRITRELALAKLEKLEKVGRYHKRIIEDARQKLARR